MTTTDHYEMPHPDADACDHAGVGKACRPCRKVLDNLHRIDLRETNTARELMAEAWEEGARATNRAWDHAYDGHPVDPDFPYYECQACDTANPHREAHHD